MLGESISACDLGLSSCMAMCWPCTFGTATCDEWISARAHVYSLWKACIPDVQLLPICKQRCRCQLACICKVTLDLVIS